MRRVQGRPQSPWNKGLNSFNLYDKFACQQKDFALRGDQRAFRSPFGNLRGILPLEGALFRNF